MNEEVKVNKIEQVDDIPVLLEHLKRMKINEIFDEIFEVHGNWQGLSPGNVLMIWLTHMISQGDHRLNKVENWVEKCQETLQRCVSKEIRPLDVSDDRLGSILQMLSKDEKWVEFEKNVNRHLLRVYDLSKEYIRVDSTTVSGYWQVTEDGLFQLGYSKNKRPDLPQVKVKMSTLDPMGIPLVTQIVSGNCADDPLYVPAIREVRESIGRSGMLYIGDCKMSSLDSRVFVAKGEDFYLCPMSTLQISREQLDIYLQQVDEQEQLTEIYRTNANGKKQMIAKGFEQSELITAVVNNQEHIWRERRLIVRSENFFKAEEKSFENRLNNAQIALEAINKSKRGKKTLKSVEEVMLTVQAILKKYRAIGLFTYDVQVNQQILIKKRYKNQPERQTVENKLSLNFAIDQQAVDKARKQLGWRVYATNCSQEYLPVQKAILAYRDQYIVEHGFSRFKGKPLSLTPTYLQREDHIVGLIRLLSIALKALCLLEFVVRNNLRNQEITGLYPDKPKRSTKTPTAEIVLQAFQGLYFSFIQFSEKSVVHITPLSKLQQHLLLLFDFPPDLYQRLSHYSLN